MDISEFRAFDDVDHWRVLGTGLTVRYRCASLSDGATLASRIADWTATTDTVPDIDLRPSSITIRIPQHGEHVAQAADVPLAQHVQRLATDMGLTSDPASLRSIQLAVAYAADVPVDAFWRAVLGYVSLDDEGAHDPADRNPPVWFHQISTGISGRGRTHIDVYVPADQAEPIVAAAVAAGGRIADDSHAPEWWTLSSPDNHGVDIAPWPDRG